jgi:ankyrin repeat protein
MVAAQWGHAAVVDKLLEKGADVNMKNTLGRDALQLAQENNHPAWSKS